VSLVLPNDMLMKVDSMSMANGLEVRTPFLDYRVVEFAFSIPLYKISRHRRKIILHEAFKISCQRNCINERKGIRNSSIAFSPMN
jgi:asparagine synthase (glutamine-hydrolysing)